MATPQMQQQTLALPVKRSSVNQVVSAAVNSPSGSPIDFTVGSWVFSKKVRPGNPNPSATALSPTGITVTGDAAGVLTITLDETVANQLTSLSNTYTILASNDAGATSQ